MFALDHIVPWGRSFDEYRRMFALTEQELGLRLLGCGDGPAGFNSEATRRGFSVISCDPIYRYSADQIQDRITATGDEILNQTRKNINEFVWTSIPSVEELGRVRMAAMTEFLQDYPAGRAVGRYIDAELPNLPFDDHSFDLALCSHLLFLYSAQLGEAFHHSAIRELSRVAHEVRIFPLLALGGQSSPLVTPVAAACRSRGFEVSIEAVPYEFQRGGNQMMRIRPR
jgi:hypothetical protein